MESFKQDFVLTTDSYLLSHSVGRPLVTVQQHFNEQFFIPWQHSSSEPWPEWLKVIDGFNASLARLFNAEANEFCPQVNLSSALTKLVMSLPQLQQSNAVVLMSEIDFPSMGFVLQKALPDSCELRFIPKDLDMTDEAVWRTYISDDIDLVFVSHVYSNTGQQAPLADIVAAAKSKQALTVIDVAQSAGIIPIDLQQLQPDFLIGSCVKWLCGGPGAAYLWVNSIHIDSCQPVDVGWFSHENPFEFDIHDFRYHHSALRFWGGTPAIAPYAIAAHSIDYFANIGSQHLHEHNQNLVNLLHQHFGDIVVSPSLASKRSGTAILNFGAQQQRVLTALKLANVSVDVRCQGIRVSPHIYNDVADINRLITAVENS